MLSKPAKELEIISLLTEIQKLNFPVDPQTLGEIQAKAFLLSTNVKYFGVENE